MVIAMSGYMGMLPSWASWPEAWTRHTPSGPSVAYPVFGSDDLTTYLARSMIAQKGTIDVSFVQGGGSSELLTDAMSEALTQNPYIFVTGWAVTDNAGLTTVAPDYTYDATEAERRRVATSSAVDALVAASGATSAGSDAEAVTLLHDAIAQGARYDWDAYNTMSANPSVSGDAAVEASQEAYGILVNHTAVCTGYAETMLLAAHAVGIPAVVVTGEATAGVTTGGHAWNRVRVDGAWRAVDVTWDDATTTDGTEVLRHDYLLLTLSDPLLASRVEDGEWVTQGNDALYR